MRVLLLLLLDVGREGGCAGGGARRALQRLVTPVQGVVDARGEGACARGGGDEGVEVEHVVGSSSSAS